MTITPNLRIVLAGVLALAALPAQAQSRDTAAAQWQQRLQQEQTATREAHEQIRRLQAEMALKDELLELGRTRNAEMYAVAGEILGRLSTRKGLDPALQLKRVRMENLMQDYEDRLRAARIHSSTLPPSLQQRMDQELEAGAKTTETGSP